MKITYYATAENGKLKISNRKMFDAQVLALEGKRVELTLQKAKKIRSTSQNNYLWGIVYQCALHGFIDAGNELVTIEDTHEFFKSRFIQEGKTIVIPHSGETVTVAKSTTGLSTVEFMEYIASIIKFSAEYLNVVIPDPTPLWDIPITDEI